MFHPNGDRRGAKVEKSIESIDRYQLVSRLGKGGMAEVFRAKLTGIGGFERDVAVKVLLPSYASEPEFVEMLLDEARIAGAIDHPNVLQVLDVGRKGELFYLVMEYIDGLDLRGIAKQIPGGRLPVGMSLYVMSEMLRGLTAVHEARDERGQPRNIVHRDISPGNVMVDRRGFVKLGDFGIAHASGRITRTRVGSVKGKSRYMAPEQLAGTPIDHRADLYAVGVTLFEAILGDFARESSRPTIYGPMFTWPERMPGGSMPPEVERILRKAITDTAQERYRDAREMRAEIEALLHRMAPGYGPDVLSRELRRLLGEGSGPIGVSAEVTQDGLGVSLRPVRFIGAATAEHTMPPTPGAGATSISAMFDRTPVQTIEPKSSTTQPTLPPRVGNAFEAEAEKTVEAPPAIAIPPEMMPQPVLTSFEGMLGPRVPINRRLAAGLIVAALALVTVGIAAAVATSGGSTPPQVIAEEKPAPSPVVAPLPQAMPLPTGSGFVDVHGPAGAAVQVGHTAYHAAPVRIELPEGDYLVQLRFRVGKRFRVVHRPAHVVAGQVVTLR